MDFSTLMRIEGNREGLQRAMWPELDTISSVLPGQNNDKTIIL